MNKIYLAVSWDTFQVCAFDDESDRNAYCSNNSGFGPVTPEYNPAVKKTYAALFHVEEGKLKVNITTKIQKPPEEKVNRFNPGNPGYWVYYLEGWSEEEVYKRAVEHLVSFVGKGAILEKR